MSALLCVLAAWAAMEQPVSASLPTKHSTATEENNLLANGAFAGPAGDGVPAPWRAALTSSEVDYAFQGSIETVSSPFSGHGNAVRLTKRAEATWWPGPVLRATSNGKPATGPCA